MSTTKTPRKKPVKTTVGESAQVVAHEEPTSKIIAPLTPKLRAPAMPAERAAKFDDSERLARIASNPEPLSAKPLLDPPGSTTIAPRKAVPRKVPVRATVPTLSQTPHEATPLTPLAQAMGEEFIPQRAAETFSAQTLPERVEPPLAEIIEIASIEGATSKLKKIAPPVTAPTPMTLAQRLEMARLARESAPTQIVQTESIDTTTEEPLAMDQSTVAPSVLAKPAPMSVRKVPASVLVERAMATASPMEPSVKETASQTSIEHHAHQATHEAHKNTTRRVVASKPALPTSAKPATAPVVAARNVMLGFALAYVEQFERHIGGPLMTLWTHKGSFVSGFFHVMMPLLMAYLCSHWTPETQAFFLEGGYMSNLGKLSWLYVVSGFLWTLLFMLASRLFLSFKQDGARFERIGRGFLSPHNDK